MNENRNEEPLGSWKEIGAYLQRNEATARRWEREERLPVHRHSHKSRSSVYAYPSEIDAWRASRKLVPETAPPLPLWKTLLAPPRSLAFGATMLLCLAMVGNGIRPQAASAQSKQDRQIWQAEADQDPSEGVPSADGQYIGFTDWATGELGLRNLANGQSRLLTSDAGWVTSRDYAESSAISPDNRQIAFAWFSTKDVTYELRVMPMAGGRPRTVYRGAQEREYPKVVGWTPDGQRVLVIRTENGGASQIAFISVQDGSVGVLKTFSGRLRNARLSPAGRFIAYDAPANERTQEHDIFVIATDGSRETRVVQGPSNDGMPQWSPDGSRIVFLSDRTGNPSLWSVDTKDGRLENAPELVKPETGNIQLLGIARSGALQYVAPASSRSNVYSAAFDTDKKVNQSPALAVQRFLHSNSGPQISPDGSQLAYVSSRAGGTIIVIRNLSTGEEREVKVPFNLMTRYGHGPMWFPDGRSVLLASRGPQQQGALFYRVNAGNGAAEQIHRVSWATGFQLSPDGKAIYYTEQPPGAGLTTRLVRFDLASRRETELKNGERFIGVAVSPDGAQLAYTVDAGREGFLAVMPASGGDSREVFRSSHWADEALYNAIVWTPDQEGLVFAQSSDGALRQHELWEVPVSGGRAQRIGVSTAGRIKSPQIHPDGKGLFFSTLENSPYEVWALENFLPKAK